jgi:hypothetical protein
MNNKIKASVNSLSSLINILDVSKDSVKGMFIHIDKYLSVDEKIEKAEDVINSYISDTSTKINNTDVNESLKEATILSLTKHVEKTFEKFVLESENMQLPSIFKSRYGSEEAYQIALNGDLEMCYRVSHKNPNLSSSEKINLLKIAAEGGHPEACNELSIILSLGRDTPDDAEMATIWAEKSFDFFKQQNILGEEFKNYLKINFDREPEDILEKVISWCVIKKAEGDFFVADRVISSAYESSFLSFPITTKGYSVIIQNLADNYLNGVGVAQDKNKHKELMGLVYLCHKLENFKHTKSINSDYNDTIDKIKEINGKIATLNQ